MVVGNWKMNLSTAQAISLAGSLARTVHDTVVSVCVCPSFPAVAGVHSRLERSSIAVGAQDVSWGRPGARTGEVSAEDLASIGCRYVIIGHSERRQHCGETDHMVQQKVFSAMGHGLTPIVCVGETADQRSSKIQYHVVSRQIHSALHNVPPPRLGQQVLIAYEPVWAISPGGPALPADAQAMAQVIHQALVDVYGEKVTNASTRILYGGSVDAGNVASFVDGEHVHGVLVGRDSLDPKKFNAIINSLAARADR